MLARWGTRRSPVAAGCRESTSWIRPAVAIALLASVAIFRFTIGYRLTILGGAGLVYVFYLSGLAS